MNVSVIIPTRNRSRRLQATLAAVSRQAFPGGHVEVIVVDDGSDDETPLVARALAMPGVEYVRQPHGGACAARNKGAASARGQLLVFVDDDVELMPDAIAMLAAAHRHCPGAVVFGRLVRPEPANRYERLQVFPEPDVVSGDTRVDCTQCLTGLLSIGREEFFALGQFQDPTGGWPSWDDIAFGYRALNAGIALVRTSDARGVHHDESSSSLQGTARRWQAASEAAIRLFSRYPDLQDRFPFYRDKLPISWGRDPSSLVARKLLRSLVCSWPALEVFEYIADVFIRRDWPARLTRPLCGYVISGHMWRGLRRGLELHGPLPEPGSNHAQ